MTDLYTGLTHLDKEVFRSRERGIEVFNVDQLSRSYFADYDSNGVLRDAIDKRQTVEESLRELSGSRTRSLFPRKRDDAYNFRVKEMGELVHAEYRRRLGIFRPDNATTSSVYADAVVFGFFTALGASVYLTAQNPEFHPRVLIVYAIPLAISAFTDSAAFLASWNTPKPQIEKAKYIDGRISELYS